MNYSNDEELFLNFILNSTNSININNEIYIDNDNGIYTNSDIYINSEIYEWLENISFYCKLHQYT